MTPQIDIEDYAGVRQGVFRTLPAGHFGAIAADPPWRYQTWSDKGQARGPDYDLMTLDDIKALPVSELAAEDCVLFLWVTNPFLPRGFEVMSAWGFTYKAVAFTWAKLTPRSGTWLPKYHIGLGHWTRQNSETCLLGVRGKPKRQAKDVRELLVTPRREHSRKPEEFYESVERLVPGPYLDLFSRAERPGWTAWGNQTSKFTEAAE